MLRQAVLCCFTLSPHSPAESERITTTILARPGIGPGIYLPNKSAECHFWTSTISLNKLHYVRPVFNSR
jgi:hypothetical protein